MLVLVAPSAPIYLIEATYVSRMQTRFRIPQSLPLFWSSRLQKRSRQNKRSIVISLTTGRMEASAAHGTRNSGKQLPKPAAFPTNYPLAVSYPIAGLRTDLCNQPHRLSYSTRAFVVNRFNSLKLYAQSWPSSGPGLPTDNRRINEAARIDLIKVDDKCRSFAYAFYFRLFRQQEANHLESFWWIFVRKSIA